MQHITYALPKEEKKDKKSSSFDQVLGVVVGFALLIYLGIPLLALLLRLAADFWSPYGYYRWP